MSEGRRRPKSKAANLSPIQSSTVGYNTASSYLPTAFYSEQNWCWPAILKVHRPKGRLIWAPQYWFQAFPFWQFHVLFNSLFKVLFIFPSRYLFAIGLSPIFSFRWYLPPILDSNPKLSDSLKTYHTGADTGSSTGFSPSMMLRSNRLLPGLPPKTFLETTIRSGNLRDFKIELFPLHSPLLGESQLVSFPPLIDMLKFSGFSYLIWDHEFRFSPSIAR